MVEVPLDFPRAWLEFADPANPHQQFRCDLTWLTSRYSCIFGRGCRGIDDTAPLAGCCSLGAHFSDAADEKRVKSWVKKLTKADWEHYKTGHKSGFAEEVKSGPDKGERKTRVVKGACIFHNSPDFAGGYGCALHHLAEREGVSFVETKPEVCWQVPMRRAFDTEELPDGTEREIVTITEYDRRAWGAGGHDLDWYCSGNTEAHTASEPVYLTHRDELVALMGLGAYEVVAEHCAQRVKLLAQVRDTQGRRALAVHPADPVPPV
ncbi:MAG: hypothetical protein ACYYNF_09355 [Actinomycetes bacterium]|nr:hypothetical protein [Candidatus Nanopelagicales bacterium]MDP4825756.1 hypothetical protein [Candidatus Nanopelagicales bacterium]MDP4888120.1 hypothetical protein [Candidatus Nanopelagicales bacterium]